MQWRALRDAHRCNGSAQQSGPPRVVLCSAVRVSSSGASQSGVPAALCTTRFAPLRHRLHNDSGESTPCSLRLAVTVLPARPPNVTGAVSMTCRAHWLCARSPGRAGTHHEWRDSPGLSRRRLYCRPMPRPRGVLNRRSRMGRAAIDVAGSTITAHRYQLPPAPASHHDAQLLTPCTSHELNAHLKSTLLICVYAGATRQGLDGSIGVEYLQ